MSRSTRQSDWSLPHYSSLFCPGTSRCEQSSGSLIRSPMTKELKTSTWKSTHCQGPMVSELTPEPFQGRNLTISPTFTAFQSKLSDSLCPSTSQIPLPTTRCRLASSFLWVVVLFPPLPCWVVPLGLLGQCAGLLFGSMRNSLLSEVGPPPKAAKASRPRKLRCGKSAQKLL